MKSLTSPPTDCTAVTAAVAILGDKWTPLLIRALSEQPMGFCQLQQAVGGINPRTLSARLTRLECSSIIDKHATEQSLHPEYSLSVKGKALLPILGAMADWSQTYSTF
ncbi:MAG TPA: helix-turn-helix domain-containing protein [Candidatus Saccharimonadales bacterium]|jgi:DNA-binding HxlR family transcriptional regulator|nr:helix-turn-helix domain-containing protein [Candidatus Saccharimonadales bacterium]